MAWLALILGIAALWVALTTRAEQARQQNQVDRLKLLLFKERPKASGDTDLNASHDRSTPDQIEDDAATAAEETSHAYPGVEHTLNSGPDAGPEPATPAQTIGPLKKNKTLHRLASVDRSESSADDAASRGFEPAVKAVTKTKAKAVSFEERLGAGVYVWAGGIALMLAGAFLVKYSFDHDLMSVRSRLALAGSFGVVLVLASLWVRSRADKVAAAICGAGVADLFATVLAATAFYHEVDPWLGFALMALVTATAVGMSLLHGRFVALLGLIGGFVTPTLVNGVESAWGPTFTYLLLLEIGLAVVTRKRQWFGLSALTLLMSVLAALVYAVFSWSPDSRGWLIMFVLGSAVVFVLNAARRGEEQAGSLSPLRRLWLGLGAVGSSALLLSMLVAMSRFSVQELSALGLLGAGSVLLARLDRRYVTLAFLAQGLCGMMLLAWPLAYEFMDAELEPTRYFQVAIGYGSVFAVGGFLCLWRNARPAVFAWLSASGAGGFAILAHLGGAKHLPQRLDWWMVYAAIAGVLTVAAASVWRSRTRHENRVINAYALGAAALVTLGFWFGLDHPFVAIAWAGLAVVATALDRGLRLPRLLVATGWLTVGCVVLLIVPGPEGYEMPMRMVANTMLAHYGLPALCFAAIAWMVRRHTWPNVRDAFQAVALVTATAAVSLQVRLGFHPDDLWTRPAALIEWASYVALWLGVCWIVLRRFTSATLDGLQKAAVAIGVVGLVAAVLYLMWQVNPLFRPADLGEMRVLNWLLYAYGLPCVLALLVARALPEKAGVFKQIAAGVSFALLFALVSLEIRQGFVGPNLLLDTHPISSAESYSYSLAWVLLALTLLVGGLVTGSAAIRYGSLAVMLVAIGKVALDTAQLRDLWRVLSLLGLGLSLIVLGYVYQRYVFRRPPG